MRTHTTPCECSHAACNQVACMGATAQLVLLQLMTLCIFAPVWNCLIQSSSAALSNVAPEGVTTGCVINLSGDGPLFLAGKLLADSCRTTGQHTKVTCMLGFNCCRHGEN